MTWADVAVSLRPRQWVKNLFVAAPLVFTGNLFHPLLLAKTALAVLLFCAVSSGGYIWNDLADRERDRSHPRKRDRPIASGRFPPGPARWLGSLLLFLPLPFAYVLSPAFFALILSYAALTIVYSLLLRKVAILDMVAIGMGFVLRVLAGAVLIEVPVSPWIVLATAFLALLLAALKRKQEVMLMGREAEAVRPMEVPYRLSFLQQCVMLFTEGTLITYALYTFFSRTAQQAPLLFLTIPLVFYGLLRYLFVLEHEQELRDPDEVLFRDRPLQVTLLLWLGLCAFLLG